MSFFSRSVPTLFIKGGLTLAGVIGLATFAISSAAAENASIQGAVTRTTPGGYSSSTTGEMIAPNGMHFSGPLQVTPTFTTPPGGGASIPTSLAVSTASGLQTIQNVYDPQFLATTLTNQALILGNPMLLEAIYAAMNIYSPGLGDYWRQDPVFMAYLIAAYSFNQDFIKQILAASYGTSDVKQAVITKLNTIDINTQQGRDAFSAIVKAASGIDGLE